MMQSDMFPAEQAVLDAMRSKWRKAIEGDGGVCPCCDRHGKVYKLTLHKTFACAIAWLVAKAGQDGWVEVQNKGPRWLLRSKNYGMLTHWGLIESAGTRSGVWRATQKGRDFICGNITVPAAVFIYDDKTWGFDDSQTTFGACIKNRFDFEEMMDARFDWANIMEEIAK